MSKIDALIQIASRLSGTELTEFLDLLSSRDRMAVMRGLRAEPDDTDPFHPRLSAGDQATLDASASPADDTTPEPRRQSENTLSGRQLGEYTLVREIARSGMGVVFEAWHEPLNRTVALKLIRSAALPNQDDVGRFQTEAEAAAKLSHPGIVPVFDSGCVDGQFYFTMDLVLGGSLADLGRSGALSERRAAQIVHDTAIAVHYAHTRNIVHRDLKPSNVLIDEAGRPKVTDFGLAKNLEDASGLTMSGAIMGTPCYMAPEQGRGETGTVGPLSDVYAMGGILYFLLTGRPPFQGKNPIDTIQQVVHSPPAPLQRLRPRVNLDIATICMRCLEKDPNARYQSALEVADELQLFLERRPIKARPVSQLEKSRRWCVRQPLASGLLGATLFPSSSASRFRPTIGAKREQPPNNSALPISGSPTITSNSAKRSKGNGGCGTPTTCERLRMHGIGPIWQKFGGS